MFLRFLRFCGAPVQHTHRQIPGASPAPLRAQRTSYSHVHFPSQTALLAHKGRPDRKVCHNNVHFAWGGIMAQAVKFYYVFFPIIGSRKIAFYTCLRTSKVSTRRTGRRMYFFSPIIRFLDPWGLIALPSFYIPFADRAHSRTHSLVVSTNLRKVTYLVLDEADRMLAREGACPWVRLMSPRNRYCQILLITAKVHIRSCWLWPHIQKTFWFPKNSLLSYEYFLCLLLMQFFCCGKNMEFALPVIAHNLHPNYFTRTTIGFELQLQLNWLQQRLCVVSKFRLKSAFKPYFVRGKQQYQPIPPRSTLLTFQFVSFGPRRSPDMGFEPYIRKLLGMTRGDRQTLSMRRSMILSLTKILII